MSALVDGISGQPIGGIRLNDFGGGRVNVPEVMAPAGLRPNQAQRSQNVDISGRSIRKMRGFVKQTNATVTGDISSIHYDIFTGNVYVAYGTVVGKMNGARTSITGLTGATGLTNNAIASFGRVGDYLMVVNGSDAPHTWKEASSTWAAIATPPATWIAGNYPSFVCPWMGRNFAAGCANEPDILYYSKLWDTTVWSAGVAANSGGAIRIGNDGNPIKALWPLANGLLVFKDPGLYYLSGSATYNTATNANEFDQTSFDWQQLSKSVGCISHRALVDVDQVLYVWGRDNVFALETNIGSAAVNVRRIGNMILNDVLSVSLRQNEICAVHYPDRKQVWFGVAKDANSTGVDTVHCYSYDTSDKDDPDGWMLRTGYSHKCMANVRDTSNRTQIYSGGYNGSSYVYLQNSGVNLDGAAMECIHNTYWSPQGLASKGHSNYVFIMMGPQTSGDMSYAYAYDFDEQYYDSDTITPDSNPSVYNNTGSSTFGDTYGSGNTGTWLSGLSFVQKVPIFGRGHRMQHRFYSNLVGADFDILEILHSVATVGFA